MVTIRPNRPEDAFALGRLAQLDSSSVPAEPMLAVRAKQLLAEPTSVRTRVTLGQLIRRPKVPWSSSSTTSAASRMPPT
jgi:hypothetical protein